MGSNTPPPNNLRDVISSEGAQLGAAVISGLVVSYFVSGWESALLSGFGVFLVLSFISHRFLTPKPHPDVSDRDKDQEGLTGSITSSHRSAYAISSNWPTLWQGSTFRYYLHLDATMSLVAYSSDHYSPLERYSTDDADQRRFYDEGLALARSIADGTYPRPRHRLRLLIYPEWVYTRYAADIEHLIKSHTAARIPCIPLLADKLQACLSPQEAREMEHIVEQLAQNALDKMPALPPVSEWRNRWAARRRKRLRYWPPLFPDMLLIDSRLNISTSAVWWYASDGHVDKWSHGDDRLEQANRAFRVICRYVEQTKWANYGPGNLGGVALSSTPDTLFSEAFFARPYYDKWLLWIERNAGRNNAASQLQTWLTAETAAIHKFVQTYVEEVSKERTIEILDVGCGFGRHLIGMLASQPTLSGLGVDINARMVSEASRAAKAALLHRRVHFMVEDAAELAHCRTAEFDLAICTTNTLGNLSEPKRGALLARLVDVVRPGGRVMVSVYSSASTAARLESYRAIELHPEEDGRRIVTTEGLESETFAERELRRLMDADQYRIISSGALGDLGLMIVVERRSPHQRDS
jgi:SAM-dependent methyltransferase